jgi:hypothetical protein
MMNDDENPDPLAPARGCLIATILSLATIIVVGLAFAECISNR